MNLAGGLERSDGIARPPAGIIDIGLRASSHHCKRRDSRLFLEAKSSHTGLNGAALKYLGIAEGDFAAAQVVGNVAIFVDHLEALSEVATDVRRRIVSDR